MSLGKLYHKLLSDLSRWFGVTVTNCCVVVELVAKFITEICSWCGLCSINVII